MARNLFGTGDPKKLPNLSNPHHWKSEVTQFFDDGKWLVENADNATKSTFTEAKRHLRQAVAMSVLNSQGWTLLINPGIKDEQNCKQDGGSNIWMHGNECWGLYQWKLDYSMAGRYQGPKLKVTQLPGESVQKMKDYDMGFQKVYRNAVDCKKAHGGDSARAINVKDLRPNDGKLPECFFSIDVKKGTFDGNQFVEQKL